MFESEIYNIISTDSSISEYSDFIFVNDIPLEDQLGYTIDEKSNSVIVINYSKEETTSTRDDRNYLVKWRLFLYSGSPVAEDTRNITSRLEALLGDYTSDNILNIQFLNDDPNYDTDEGIFYNNQEFEVLYTG